MRAVIQRVSSASVCIDGAVKSSIGLGLLVLLGVGQDDDESDIDYLVKKTAALRIFNDDAGVMNLSVMDVGGDVIVVSQFTLMASTKKGNRPSYIEAAGHEKAIPMYASLGLGLQFAGFHLDAAFLTASKTLGNTFMVSLGYAF